MTSRSRREMRRCLVVDDHEVSRRFTVAALRRIAGTVTQTGSGLRALRLALCEWPEIIVLDVHLRAMNGITLAGQIRAAWPDDRRKPRIIVLSGLPSERIEDVSDVGTIDTFLVKPISAEQLQAAALGRKPTAHAATLDTGRQGLAELFREELEARFPSLDRAISHRDLARAGEILHQLIASAAICRAPQLERRLRALDSACRDDAGSRELAHRYYALVTSVRGYLAAGGTATAS